MSRITPEEVKSLARLSRLELTQEEIDSYTHDITQVLTYVERLSEVLKNYQGQTMPPAAQVTRVDEPQETASAPILREAPQREDSFFVVPVIIK